MSGAFPDVRLDEVLEDPDAQGDADDDEPRNPNIAKLRDLVCLRNVAIANDCLSVCCFRPQYFVNLLTGVFPVRWGCAVQSKLLKARYLRSTQHGRGLFQSAILTPTKP